MSLLHPLLLGLLALAAVPVILHFMMRPKPKRLLFPALRLIEARRKTNVRRLRLRHIWLLLLRMAIIILLVLAIARPLVPAANYALTTRELLSLLAVGMFCVSAYFVLVRWWSRKASARHEILYRRTLARAATGIAAAILVLLLVAWPYARRVSAEVSDPTQVIAEDRAVAAVFLFDTSRSMEYQFEGTSRLEVAKTVALAHLSSLPAGSRVAVADSAGLTPVIFQADLAGAKERIEALQSHARHTPLDQRARAAFELQAQDREQGLGQQTAVPEKLRRDPFVRAVYVFTDLASSAWTESKTLRERLEADKWLQFYLVDAGVEDPVNVGIAAVRPSDEVVTTGSRVTVRADLAIEGPASQEATVELYVNGGSGPVKQGQTTVEATAGRSGRVSFPLPNVAPPVVQGELRLVRSDPFSPDDVRYFSIAVEPSPKVLLVSDRSTDAFLWGEALKACRFDVTRIATDRLGRQDLGPFAVTFLINATAPTNTDWEKLGEYVRSGGGLGVVLGARVDSFLYNADAAQTVLPARLLTQIAFTPPETFRPIDDGHPVFARFDELEGGYGWLTVRDVRRHYVVEPNESSATIATYTFAVETRPALLVRSLDAGRVAMLTTGVDAGGWSDLANARGHYLAFADQLTQFLAGRSGGRRNFDAGDEAVIRFGRTDLPQQLLLRTPNLEQRPVDVPQGGRGLAIRDLNDVGHYELASPPGEPKYAGGFSVNLPGAESDFTRLTKGDLDEQFGEGRYSLARDPQSLAVVVRDATLGAELMPYVLMVLVVVFCGEHLVANRFYDEEQSPEHR